ncbi:MAG: alpha-galactosidase [Clostridia bacterium]|nr:alpha-galactosidase [Clostridia bacterium]
MLKSLFKATAAAAAATGIALSLNNKTVSASAVAARAVNAAKVTKKSEKSYDNGVALTPPMGWSSWNTFRRNINEKLILEVATAMANSGLKQAGYQYINLDDCWQSSARDENGRFVADYATFPRGIKPLVDEINELGLKVGIYSSNGTHTCEDLPASLGFEAVDADTFAEWGIEYFKYDFCHNKPTSTSAPNIERMVVSDISGADILTLEAKDAVLTGHARVAKDTRFPGEYITGLGGNIGTATFNDIVVEEDGEYILSFTLRKRGNYYKYARIVVNGSDEYEITTAPTMAQSAEGRAQVLVKLNIGANSVKIFNPFASRMDAAAHQYTKMGLELKRATREFAERMGTEEKPICYSICEWGLNRPWNWGKEAGNLWRTTMDIKANWPSIVSIYEQNVRLAKHAGPGGWNDPDMLEVGNGSLSMDENRAHFTLWCMMAAPLILGNDIRRFLNEDGTAKEDDAILRILTNKDLIAIDQDSLGVQCVRHKTNIKVDVLVKPLSDGTAAVCFFNKFGEAIEEELSIKEIIGKDYCNLPDAVYYECKELWTGEEFDTDDEIEAYIAPHSVKIYKITAKED